MKNQRTNLKTNLKLEFTKIKTYSINSILLDFINLLKLESMRKWTYLVAVLLMAGTSTSLLTSCIDNDEPAGIIDLRGAKAELLRAKAAVEQAEAAIKTAQVNGMKLKQKSKIRKQNRKN